jgi:hypothetical protein
MYLLDSGIESDTTRCNGDSPSLLVILMSVPEDRIDFIVAAKIRRTSSKDLPPAI